MEYLIVFYSRSGHTKLVAQAIQNKLNCDMEEIIDKTSRKGLLGYILAGHDAMLRRKTEIEKPQCNPADYDLVIIGTPVWGWNLPPALAAYLGENKAKIKKAAFFCTFETSGGSKVFNSMESILDKKSIATLEVQYFRGWEKGIEEQVNDFVQQI